MANWIRRIVAVSQHVLERCITAYGLVLAKGGQQVGKRLARNVELPDRFPQGNKYRMTRDRLIPSREIRLRFIYRLPEVFQRRFDHTYVGRVQFAFPFVEQHQRLLGIATSSPRSSEIRQ